MRHSLAKADLAADRLQIGRRQLGHGVTEAVGRWLGFLHRFEPSALAEPPLDRVTEDRLTNYVAHLAETVESVGRHLYLSRLQKAFRVMFQGAVPDILMSLVAQLKSRVPATLEGLGHDPAADRARRRDDAAFDR